MAEQGGDIGGELERFQEHLSPALAVCKILQGEALLLHIDSGELELQQRRSRIFTYSQPLREIAHRGMGAMDLSCAAAGLTRSRVICSGGVPGMQAAVLSRNLLQTGAIGCC